MAVQVLRLVENETSAGAKTPVERVFAHWVFMLGKNPRRCALGPTRRRVIERALELYEEDVLCLAVDGNAASAWHAGENDRRTAYNDIELILRNEATIERFAEAGERLRQRALRQRQADAQAAPDAPQADPALVAEQRERLRKMAAQLAGRRHD